MQFLKRTLIVLVLLVAGLAALLWFMLGGGTPHPDGQVTQSPLSEELIELRDDELLGPETRILFGDLHVHTTLSVDAFQQCVCVCVCICFSP